jgi:hypothetical protein
MKLIIWAAWSFRGATEGGKLGIDALRHWLWIPLRRIRSRGDPRSAIYDAHTDNSRCALAARNDAANDSNLKSLN